MQKFANIPIHRAVLALEYVPAQRLMVNPDCGLRHLPTAVAQAKLRDGRRRRPGTRGQGRMSAG